MSLGNPRPEIVLTKEGDACRVKLERFNIPEINYVAFLVAICTNGGEDAKIYIFSVISNDGFQCMIIMIQFIETLPRRVHDAAGPIIVRFI